MEMKTKKTKISRNVKNEFFLKKWTGIKKRNYQAK